MTSQLVYFLACVGLGLAAFILYALMRRLAKKTNLVPVTVILDFVWCGVLFSAFLVLNVLLKDGQPYLYAFCGTAGGFFLGMLLLTLIKEHCAKRSVKPSAGRKRRG